MIDTMLASLPTLLLFMLLQLFSSLAYLIGTVERKEEEEEKKRESTLLMMTRQRTLMLLWHITTPYCNHRFSLFFFYYYFFSILCFLHLIRIVVVYACIYHTIKKILLSLAVIWINAYMIITPSSILTLKYLNILDLKDRRTRNDISSFECPTNRLDYV